jgi:hypothetical protein
VSSNLCDDYSSLFPPLREHLAIYLGEVVKEISVDLILNLPSFEFAVKGYEQSENWATLSIKIMTKSR